MKTVEMPVNAYYCLLRSIPCTESILTPRHTVTDANAAEQYVQAREFWIQNGWAELDFDGSMQLSAELARLLYNISHMEYAFRWQRQQQTEYWIMGPVDFLWVREADGKAQLSLRQNSAILRYLKNETEKSPEGKVSAKRAADGRTAEGELSPDREQSAKTLADCLSLMAREVQNA